MKYGGIQILQSNFSFRDFFNFLRGIFTAVTLIINLVG